MAIGPWLARGILAVIPLLSAGCTIVQRTSADGSREVRYTLASPIVVVNIPPGGQEVTKITGVGVGVDALTGTYTMGLFRMSRVQIDPSCRVVVFPASDVQMATFLAVTHGIADFCVEGKAVRGSFR